MNVKLFGYFLALVVITTMAGYSIAAAPFNIITFLCCCVGTGLVSSAANAINQYHEVPFDAQMSRTKNRVLVKAQLTYVLFLKKKVIDFKIINYIFSKYALQY